jgi:hypothetical protein
MKTSRSKHDDQNRRDTILVIILVFVCIGLFGVGSLVSQEIKQYPFLSMLGGGSLQTNPEIIPTTSPTPKPTNTPIPTRSPKKNQAVKPPSKNAASPPGLGISLEQIQSVYVHEDFEFTDTITGDDKIHSLGKTPNGLAAIELNGNPGDIKTAAVITYLAKNRPEQLKDNLNFMAQMIKTVLPGWKDGTKWLYANVGQLATSKIRPIEIETISLNIRIHLKMMESPSLIILSLEPATNN